MATYISTRGEAPKLGFCDVMLPGLARDGGLYVPEAWPRLAPEVIAGFLGRPYWEVAVEVIRPFVAGEISDADLGRMANEAYATFRHPAVVPLDQSGPNQFVLELFHGPTLAFKDVAMQFLGPLFDHVLTKRGTRICIVGATSGDTGSAAIEAVKNRDNIDAFILYPHGRVSEVQRRQMTTVDAANIHTVAMEGTFDDCQDAVKALFNDLAFRDRYSLSAVNSINWARVMAQVVYYFWAALKLGAPEGKVAFAVPTGNFGNVFAGYVAGRMGLPIDQFVVGSNANDILTRFFASGAMEMTEVMPTISPSMDIQVSSNFERLLFELYGRDGKRVAETLAAFRASGRFDVPADILAAAKRQFDGARFDDDATRALIGTEYKRSGQLLDPHSAVGLAAARARRKNANVPLVVLATAHPAKFPDAVEQAAGVRPKLPPHMADLMTRPERVNVLANDLDALRAFIVERVSA